MIVGTDDVPEVYTQLDKNARVPIGEAGNSVFLHQVSRRKDGRFQVIVNAENLRRPTYYMPDFKNKLLNCKVYDRERNRGKTEIFTIEEILADPDTVPDRRKFKLK